MIMKDVKSSSISKIGYDVLTKNMKVEFSRGVTYKYLDIPELVYVDIINAESVGKEFHRLIIKEKKSYIKIDKE